MCLHQCMGKDRCQGSGWKKGTGGARESGEFAFEAGEQERCIPRVRVGERKLGLLKG